MQNTKIEWCNTIGPDGKSYPGMTFNPWWGCQKVSPACTNCYAATFANRYYPGLWGPAKTTPRKIASEDYWKQPIKWNEKAKKLNVRLKVFCASMSDVFEDHPGVVEARLRLFNLIVLTPNLNWLLLTKRPENILKMVPLHWEVDFFPDNVWVGTTVENQQYADERIPHLLKVPAKVRFLSMEPLCGPVDITNKGLNNAYSFPTDHYTEPHSGKKIGIEWTDPGDAYIGLDWVIAGGESGSKATPSHPDWFRSLRDQCKAAGVPFFFKQWGEFTDGSVLLANKTTVLNNGDYSLAGWEHALRGRNDSVMSSDEWNSFKPTVMSKVGKKAAGRLLDEMEYNDMPL